VGLKSGAFIAEQVTVAPGVGDGSAAFSLLFSLAYVCWMPQVTQADQRDLKQRDAKVSSAMICCCDDGTVVLVAHRLRNIVSVLARC
jgi:hypothetical protein